MIHMGELCLSQVRIANKPVIDRESECWYARDRNVIGMGIENR